MLSAVHYNLGKTLQDVENIAALPNEAAEAEELLSDDMNLLQVPLFHCLRLLSNWESKRWGTLGAICAYTGAAAQTCLGF